MRKVCQGRVVIVTGAARGMGREHALCLAEHGARVVVNDPGVSRDGAGRDFSAAGQVAEEIRAAGGQAIANGDDVGTWQGAQQLVQSAIDHFGGLDVLVNNAGILRGRAIVNMTESEWDAVVNVHRKGAFALMHHAAAYWRARQNHTGEPVNARIINTSSSPELCSGADQIDYGSAKAEIAAMTLIGARELGRYGVTVNAICPHAQEIEARHPRWIAPMIAWLASEESFEITGRVFEVGGGILSAMEGWHRGPCADPVEDPGRIGPVLLELARRARRNADMKSNYLD